MLVHIPRIATSSHSYSPPFRIVLGLLRWGQNFREFVYFPISFDCQSYSTLTTGSVVVIWFCSNSTGSAAFGTGRAYGIHSAFLAFCHRIVFM